MGLLTFSGDGEGGFSTVGVVILGNRCGIQGQNYVGGGGGGGREYDLLFDVDIVNLPLKNNLIETEGTMLLFL